MNAAFAAALLDPDAPVPEGLRAWNGSDPALRFAVYRNNVVASLVAALGDTFPVLRRIAGGAGFDVAAAAFARAHPPRSPVLADWGDGFADWLEGFAPARALPFAPDLARLERARVVACHAADALPLAPPDLARRLADPARLPAARLRLHPSCRALVSRFRIATLWAAHQAEGEPPAVAVDAPEGALVLRDPHDEVLVVPVPAADAGFVAALAAGAPLGEAAAAAPGADLVAALVPLLRHGAIVDWS